MGYDMISNQTYKEKDGVILSDANGSPAVLMGPVLFGSCCSFIFSRCKMQRDWPPPNNHFQEQTRREKHCEITKSQVKKKKKKLTQTHN